MAVLRCTEAFAYKEKNGVLRVLRPGDLVESTDPAAKLCASSFEEAEVNARQSTERAIEQATAEPGEKRTVTRAAKKAAK